MSWQDGSFTVLWLYQIFSTQEKHVKFIAKPKLKARQNNIHTANRAPISSSWFDQWVLARTCSDTGALGPASLEPAVIRFNVFMVLPEMIIAGASVFGIEGWSVLVKHNNNNQKQNRYFYLQQLMTKQLFCNCELYTITVVMQTWLSCFCTVHERENVRSAAVAALRGPAL